MPFARMAHPKDRPGLTRGRLLKGAAGSALAVSGVGALAGCQNTTESIGSGEGGGVNSRFVEAKPVGPGGLPLPRPDNAVTWAVTDDNRPILDRRTGGAGSPTVENTGGPTG